MIGFAFLRIKRRLPNEHFSAELGIMVDEVHRGKGLGSKLMDNLIKLARKEGLKKICLTFLVDNYRAIRIYEKFGFRKTKFIKDCDVYHGKKYDCIEM